MMNMIPQNDNFVSFDTGSGLMAGGDDNQNPPLEIPGQNQTPKDIPEKSIN